MVTAGTGIFDSVCVAPMATRKRWDFASRPFLSISFLPSFHILSFIVLSFFLPFSFFFSFPPFFLSFFLSFFFFLSRSFIFCSVVFAPYSFFVLVCLSLLFLCAFAPFLFNLLSSACLYLFVMSFRSVLSFERVSLYVAHCFFPSVS